MRSQHAIVIGAGPAGLACAKLLQERGLSVVVLEKSSSVGSSWRSHYDRLHLHTDRGHSALPGLPMPRNWPRYPSRLQVLGYLEDYATRFGIAPAFGRHVHAIRRLGDGWSVECEHETFQSDIVVVATGIAQSPHRPTWAGLEGFRGPVIHSSEYRNPTPFAGRRVLVVGGGNSGCEIALDLAEADVPVTMSVRSAVQILPRDLLGLPILTWAILYRPLPARLVDRINAPIIRWAVGRVDDLGLHLSDVGPREGVERLGRVPIFDIGTLARMRDGSIKVRSAIKSFEPRAVTFVTGECETFDAVVLATGFRPDLRTMLPGSRSLDEKGMPRVTGDLTADPGLFFCGQTISATGQLREIGIEARRISGLVARPRRAA